MKASSVLVACTRNFLPLTSPTFMIGSLEYMWRNPQVMSPSENAPVTVFFIIFLKMSLTLGSRTDLIHVALSAYKYSSENTPDCGETAAALAVELIAKAMSPERTF